tara:strand:+ start:44 stop:229 length:186 start_codon:yes stop_codon:yes gene_type:complete
MPEQNNSIDTRCRVTIDERVMALVEEKRPIGQSKNAYINFLVQRALSAEPERLIPREPFNG